MKIPSKRYKLTLLLLNQAFNHNVETKKEKK